MRKIKGLHQKLDWNCVKKRIPVFKRNVQNKIVTSVLIRPCFFNYKQSHYCLQADISSVGQKLRPAARCPASAGSAC